MTCDHRGLPRGPGPTPGRVRGPGLRRPAVQHRLRVRRLRRPPSARPTTSRGPSNGSRAATRVLKPTGSFFLAIGDEYAAEHKVRLDALGLTMRNWIVWHYTFGVNCTKKFNRSHAHIFYYVRDPKRFTFNADAVRVPSARQTTYADRRANPVGKLPDDTWVLRPQESDDSLPAGRGHVVRLARVRHVQGADRPPVPDAGGGAGADHPRGEQPGRPGARPVRRQRHDAGRREETRPPVPGHRAVGGVRGRRAKATQDDRVRGSKDVRSRVEESPETRRGPAGWLSDSSVNLRSANLLIDFNVASRARNDIRIRVGPTPLSPGRPLERGLLIREVAPAGESALRCPEGNSSNQRARAILRSHSTPVRPPSRQQPRRVLDHWTGSCKPWCSPVRLQ